MITNYLPMGNIVEDTEAVIRLLDIDIKICFNVDGS